jgi:hypothetical protein
VLLRFIRLRRPWSNCTCTVSTKPWTTIDCCCSHSKRSESRCAKTSNYCHQGEAYRTRAPIRLTDKIVRCTTCERTNSDTRQPTSGDAMWGGRQKILDFLRGCERKAISDQEQNQQNGQNVLRELEALKAVRLLRRNDWRTEGESGPGHEMLWSNNGLEGVGPLRTVCISHAPFPPGHWQD